MQRKNQIKREQFKANKDYPAKGCMRSLFLLVGKLINTNFNVSLSDLFNHYLTLSGFAYKYYKFLVGKTNYCEFNMLHCLDMENK